MIVEFFDSERLRKRVSQIFLAVDLPKVDVTSFHDLSHEVKAPQNMFGAMVGSRFFCLSNGASTVTV